MKRLLLVLAIVFLLIPCSASGLWSNYTTVTVASSGTYSDYFEIPRQMVFIGACFPAMDDGDIGLEMSIDGGTYYPVVDLLTGVDAVLVSSGSDPACVEFSDIIRFAHERSDHRTRWRFTCASQTSGAVDIVVFFRG